MSRISFSQLSQNFNFCLKVWQTRGSMQNGWGAYRWTALSASRDVQNVGPANFSTSTSEFLTPVSPHSLDLAAPVSPFQGGPDLYHLPPAGTKAPPPSYSGHVSTSIPPLYASDTYISRWLAFSRVPIKPFLGSVEILNVRVFASFPPSQNLPQFHSPLGLRYYESEIRKESHLSCNELLHDCHLQDKLKVGQFLEKAFTFSFH